MPEAERVAEVENEGVALLAQFQKRKQDRLGAELPEDLQGKLDAASWKAYAGVVNRRLKMEIKEQIAVERKWKVAVTALKAGWVTVVPGNLIFLFWSIWQPAEALPFFFTGLVIAIAIAPLTWFVKSRLSAAHEKILERSQAFFDATPERNPSAKNDITLALQEVEPFGNSAEVANARQNLFSQSIQMGPLCPLFFFLMFFAHMNPSRAVMAGPRTEISKLAMEKLEAQLGMKGVALLADEIVGQGEVDDGSGDLGDLEMEDFTDVLDNF